MIKLLKIEHRGLHRLIIILTILCFPISIEVAIFFEELYLQRYSWHSYNFDNLPKLYFEFFNREYHEFLLDTNNMHKLISLILRILVLILTYILFSLIIKIINWVLEGFKND